MGVPEEWLGSEDMRKGSAWDACHSGVHALSTLPVIVIILIIIIVVEPLASNQAMLRWVGGAEPSFTPSTAG